MKKIVTFGEMMLRLSTNTGERLFQADQLHVNYGGAEANVAVSLANFGYDSYFVSKVPSNPLGNGAEMHLKSHGVHTSYLLRGGERLGTYYLEAGAGERSASVVYDRKYSSFSTLTINELFLDEMLKDAALFHVSGITLGLSSELREIVLLALKKAKQYGVATSFDFNYRAKLWSQQEAAEAIKPLLPFIDICSCGELDAVYLLRMEKANPLLPEEERLKVYYRQISEMYPNIKYLTSTFRNVISSSSNKLIGNLFVEDDLYQSKVHHMEPIIDRVGGGDAFIAGILYGILEGLPPQEIISFAAAASALKHTVCGDCNVFSKDEVLQFNNNEPGEIVR